MFVLKRENLRLGDIILSKSPDEISMAVMARSKSNYSHASLFAGSYTCIESTLDGVRSENTQRIGFAQIDDALVLRLLEPKDTESLTKILNAAANFARSKVGTEYASIREVIRATSSTNITAQEWNRQFCTRLVSQSYLAAGITLVGNTDYCTPDELEHSPKLEIVPDCLRLATEAERAIVEEENDSLDKQTDVNSTFLKAVQQLTGEDIQNFPQLDELLARDISHDQAITDTLIKSGFLEMGDQNKSENPWFYDILELRKRASYEQQVDLAFSHMDTDSALQEAFWQDYERYSSLAKRTSSKYFATMADCMLRQHQLTDERLKVWSTILSTLMF